MKKFISMVMAAAMVASLVPATAFAASNVKATAKVVDVWDKTDKFDGLVKGDDVPEAQMKVTDFEYRNTKEGVLPEAEATFTLDNADFLSKNADDLKALLSVYRNGKDVLDQKATNDDGIAENIVAGGKVEYTKVENTTIDTGADYTIDKAKAASVTGIADNTDGKNYIALDDIKATKEQTVEDQIAALEKEGYVREHYNGDWAYVLRNSQGGVKDFKKESDIQKINAMTADQVLDDMLENQGKVALTKGTTESDMGTWRDDDRFWVEIKDIDTDEFTAVFHGFFDEDDVVALDLVSQMDKTSRDALVAIDAPDFGVDMDNTVYVDIQDEGLTVTMKKVAEVGEEEKTKLEKELKIESNVGDFANGQVLELRLSNGFEFVKLDDGTGYTVYSKDVKGEDKVQIKVNQDNLDEITIKADAMEIDAASAKINAECKLTVKAIKEDGVGFSKTADPVVIAKVVEEKVVVSVDEDEDLPVIYSGVNVDNVGITDDSDHVSLKVTIEEPVVGSMDEKKALNLTLPEGVYATNVKVTDVDEWFTSVSAAEDAFAAAYKKGEYDTFEFAKRVLAETDEDSQDTGKLEFELTLVAEPDFTGDVTLTVEGAGLEKAEEVKIAKFVAPFTVEAEKNDLIIDYRNTKVPTNIVVKEAEAGLWDEDLKFTFSIDKFDDDAFENDATYKVDDKSGMEVKEAKDGLGFTVDETSDEAAVITISDISLYMSRSLAAGAYDLDVLTNAALFMYVESLYTTEDTDVDDVPSEVIGREELAVPVASEAGGSYAVADAADFVDKGELDVDAPTAKEGFVNIITAGRDQDDASFTKKVVVPVGEKYIIAGEEQITLDVPAYVSAAGYTMLPVRAVATALGIKNDNVLWNQETRTVTILYGQRIITMSAGEKVVYVNGSAIPAAAKVEIKDNRTFLPMRDLATALGVTDITWDAATKTATLNGNQGK